jgi:hypothetical protein
VNQALLEQAVTVTRPSAAGGGRYNVATEDAPGPKTYRCRLERTSALEVTDDRATQLAQWILFLPHDADVQANDLVEIDGVNYFVDGPPEAARARGHIDHWEARLRFVKG